MHIMGDMLSPELSDRDAWTGGYYELAIQLGARDDSRMQAAVRFLVGAAEIDGPWHIQWQPDRVERAGWSLEDLSAGQLCGVVTLPDGQQAICAVTAVREDDGDDWLDLCLPLEALARRDGRIGGFPFEPDADHRSLAWRLPIDDWFARIAREVSQEFGFKLAAIGFEVSGSVRAESVAKPASAERPYGIVLREGTYLRATC